LLLIVVVCIVPSALEDAPPAHRTALAIVCFGLLLYVGGVCLSALLRTIRHQAVVSDQALEVSGLWGTKRIALDSVDEARWGCLGESRTLVLRTPAQKLKLEFSFYDRPNRRGLIKFFRLRLTEAAQRNWQRFWAATWRVFDEPAPPDAEWLAAKASLRIRLCLLYYPSAVVLVPLGAAVWWWTRHDWVLAVMALLLPLWPVCHFAAPPRGKVARLQRPSQEAARIAEREYLARPGRRP
jgi:hypothetical protein